MLLSDDILVSFRIDEIDFRKDIKTYLGRAYAYGIYTDMGMAIMGLALFQQI